MKVQFSKHERGPYRGRYLDPEGQLHGTFEQLMLAGCIQAEMPELRAIFRLLMVEVSGNPCAGCPVWNNKGPACVAFQQYHSAYHQAVETQEQTIKDATTPHNVPAEHPLAGLSVKKIAEKLGVSISEIRRRKAAGTLWTKSPAL
jgi:hypothetical protein